MENNLENNKFYAFAFDGYMYEFLLGDDNLLYCDQIMKDKAINKVILKPNFWAFLNEGGYLSCDSLVRENNTKTSTSAHLISSYVISKELLEFLTLNGLVSYSTEMSYLYGLDPSLAYDVKGQSRAFKRARRKKEKILIKQKQGIFN